MNMYSIDDKNTNAEEYPVTTQTSPPENHIDGEDEESEHDPQGDNDDSQDDDS